MGGVTVELSCFISDRVERRLGSRAAPGTTADSSLQQYQCRLRRALSCKPTSMDLSARYSTGLLPNRRPLKNDFIPRQKRISLRNSHEHGPNNQALASFAPGFMRRYPG